MILLKIISFVVLVTQITSDDVFVDTTLGVIQGHTVNLANGRVVNSFLGFNFAKPPVGPLRFKPPEVPDRVPLIVADQLGDQCPQGPGGVLLLTHPLWDRYDENCLNMNIYAPNATSEEKLPVFVWFHGGGYNGGGNIQYPGHFLADKGSVVVVPNYRLGHLGFISTKPPNAASQGNFGLLDQALALQFVQDNIDKFGGDKDRVTIYGQSAGASSVGLHMVSPKSMHLFNNAIQESGCDLAIWAYLEEEQKPWEYTEDVASRLNCSRSTDEEMIDCLRTIDTETLRNTGLRCKPGWYCLGFSPVVDGLFIPSDPYVLRESGQGKKCNVITGQTTEDGSIYTASIIPVASEGPMNNTVWLEEMKKVTERFAVNFPNRTKDAIKIQQWYYRNWDDIHDGEANRQKFNELTTDVGWGFTQDYQSRLISKENSVYMYLLGYRSLNSYETIPAWLGVPHNGELPYVWGYPYLEENPEVRDDQEFYFDIIEYDKLDEEYVEYFQTMWLNFAKTGNPTPEPVPAPDGQPITNWTTYTESNKKYLYVGLKDVNVKENYRQKSHAYWREFLPNIATSPPDIRKLKNSKTNVEGIENLQDKVNRVYKQIYEHAIKSNKNLFKRGRNNQAKKGYKRN